MNLNYNNPTPGVEPVDELPPTPAGTAAGLSPFGAGPAAHAAGAQSGDEANEEANGHGPARTRSDAELTALVKDSPFLDVDHPIDAREALKMVIMFPVVLLKWAALLAAVVYSWFVLLLLLAGQPKNQPMGGIRCAAGARRRRPRSLGMNATQPSLIPLHCLRYSCSSHPSFFLSQHLPCK